MRITSSHRFFDLPGSLTLWVILPKNLHKRNNFVSHDSSLADPEWIQVPRTKTYQAESDQKDKMRHAMDDNGIPSKEIHERHREHAITAEEASNDTKPLQYVPKFQMDR
ncbi:hypothetical protein Tco_1160096 [Tanacetum coccineum]